jgi:hypothetical protein
MINHFNRDEKIIIYILNEKYIYNQNMFLESYFKTKYIFIFTKTYFIK